jgi:hypothetical protein
MKPETIKAIFTNLLFVIGVILLIVGFVQGTRTAVKLITFNEYPLDSYEETKCDQPPYAVPAVVDGGKTAPIIDEATRQTKADCKLELNHERKVRETEDIVGAITMLVSGGTLIFFFRKYILK